MEFDVFPGERFDSNQSSDTDVEDSQRDTGSGSRHDSRTNNFAQFAKRNDLGVNKWARGLI